MKKDNEYLRQRADDIRNIGSMLKESLSGADNDFQFPDGDEKFIIAAEELTPVDTMLFDHSRLLGFATREGGATSHTVILAKSLGIPAIVGVKELELGTACEIAYLDGYIGELVLDPDSDTKSVYDKKVVEEQEFIKSLETLKNSDAFTKD